MSEEKICCCGHIFLAHGYEKNENGGFHNPCPNCGHKKYGNGRFKSPCKKESCDCEGFHRPGTQANIEARAAVTKLIEDEKNKTEDEVKQRSEEANEAKEKERDLERIRSEYQIQGKPQEKNYSAHILGPYWAGIYWPKRRKKERHNNHKLSRLLYQNKRYNHDYPPLSAQAITEICELMCNRLQDVKLLDNIEIIVPVPNMETNSRPSIRCALPIATGLAAMIRTRNRKNCNSYNDVLVRVSNTKEGNKAHERRKAAERNFDVAEYIKTAENSTIKDQIVLLIDDITTSGSTANKCANLLMSYGAKQVIILCAAETKLG